MAISFAVLFADLGKIIHAAKTLNTARETTVDAEVEDVTDRIDTGITPLNSLERGGIFGPLSTALLDWQNGGDALLEALRASAERLVIAHVDYDLARSVVSVEDAVREINRQLVAAGDDITGGAAPNETQVDISDGGTAAGNGKLVFSTLLADGRVVQFYVASEQVKFRCDSASIDSPGRESWGVTGLPAENPMSGRYPSGIGIGTNMTTIDVDSTDNFIVNGGFEEADENDTTQPEGWIDGSASAALARITLTSVEVQTLAISGTPVAGYYTLSLANYPETGQTQTTAPIAFDATSGDVAAAINALVGLEDVEVSSSGTSPNLTHTITLTGVKNPGSITFASSFERNEVQTLTSSHTAGTTGTITYDGQTTGNIAYNASAATIQTALEALSNLAPGDVTLTGGPLNTTPVVITFGGALANRDVALMTFNIGNYTGGTLTLVETTTGRGGVMTITTDADEHVYHQARALKFAGNGSATGEFICQRIEGLEPLKQYIFAIALKVTSGPAAGVLKARLTTAPGGTIIDDEAGNDNDITFTLSASPPTTEAIYTGFFRTPREVPETIYLSLNMTTALTNSVDLYMDNVILAEVTELSPQGISGAIVAGNSRWVEGDQYAVSWTGSSGEMQDWFNRFFGTAQMGITLPNATSGISYPDATYIN